MYRALLPWGPGHALVVSGTGILIAGSGCVTDSQLVETTGSASCEVTLHDGGSANEQLLRDYTLSASQSTSEQWGLHWLPFTQGLYVHTLSGTAKGSITVWVDHSCEQLERWKLEMLELEHAAMMAALKATG